MRVPSIGGKDLSNHPTENIFCNHFNLNTLCAISIITTGNNPKVHDLQEICIFPLNSKYQISRTITPFNAIVKPRQHWRMLGDEFIKENKISKRENEIAWETGIDRSVLADLFESWVENKLKPCERKMIMPLVYDWGNIKPFLVDWLGPLNFESYFFFHVRDILPLSLYCNDFCDIKSEPYRIQKVDEGYICSSLKIKTDMNDTISRCHAIAQVYETLLHSFYSQLII